MEVQTIKGTTRSGIAYEINPAIKNDMRLLYALRQLQKEEDAGEQMQAVFGLFELIFGKAGFPIFMNAVADANNGVCNVKIFMNELQDILEALDLKN